MKELKRSFPELEDQLFKAYDILSAAGFEILIEDGMMQAWPKRLHRQVIEGFAELAKFDPNHMHNFYSILAPIIGQENIHFMSEEPQLSGHLLTSICTRDYTDRLRGKILINDEILARFP